MQVSTYPESTVTVAGNPWRELDFCVIGEEFGSAKDDLPKPLSVQSARAIATSLSILLHVALLGAIFMQLSSDRSDFASRGAGQGEPASQSNVNVTLTTRVYFAQEETRSSEEIESAVIETVSSVETVARESTTADADALPKLPDKPMTASAAPPAGGRNEGSGDTGNPSAAVDSYLGQIKSRVERAWDHPLTPLNERFRCQVTITQGRQGGVTQVNVGQCNGDAAWQQSLVRAINLAAPFPAAPSEETFVEKLSFSFEAEPLSMATLVSILPLLTDSMQSIPVVGEREQTETARALAPKRADADSVPRRTVPGNKNQAVESAEVAARRNAGMRPVLPSY